MPADIVDNDAKIIARCVSGSDESAWDHFVSRYSRLAWSAIHQSDRPCGRWAAPDWTARVELASG